MSIHPNTVSAVAKPYAIETQGATTGYSRARKYRLHWPRILALAVNFTLWIAIAWLIWKSV